MSKYLKINNKVVNSFNGEYPANFNEQAIGPIINHSDEPIAKLAPFSLDAAAKSARKIIIGDISESNISVSPAYAEWDDTAVNIRYNIIIWFKYENKTYAETVEYNAISSSFEQNLTNADVIRNVTFTDVDGVEHSTTVTQHAKRVLNFEVTPIIGNYGFVKTPETLPNLDRSLYDAIYTSTNAGEPNTYAIARIDFHDMSDFTIWINSNSDPYDYVVVSELDAETYPLSNLDGYSNGYSTDFSNTLGNYSNTGLYPKFLDKSATCPTHELWRKIIINNDGGNHHIFITYIKNSTIDIHDDVGRFLVEI